MADAGIVFRPSSRAVSVDTDTGSLALAGGTSVGYDHLVIATGVTPRLPAMAADLDGVHCLYDLDQSLALRAALHDSPRVLVVGAGFLGCEIAAARSPPPIATPVPATCPTSGPTSTTSSCSPTTTRPAPTSCRS